MGRNIKFSLAIFASVIHSSVSASSIEPPYNIIRAKAGEIVRLEGILDYRGEIIFYTSNEAKMLRLVFPYCVSGISEIDIRQIENFKGHKVIIEAEVLDVKPDSQSNGLSPRSLVEGIPINNWCLGDVAFRFILVERRN